MTVISVEVIRMEILKLYVLYALLIPVALSTFIDLTLFPQDVKSLLSFGAGVCSGLIGTGIYFKNKGI